MNQFVFVLVLGIVGGSAVSCGSGGDHKAPTCAKCPYEDGIPKKSWCNGDCVWFNNKCIAATASSVRCGGHGGHKAPTCAECPNYGCPVGVPGASDDHKCNSEECIWTKDTCTAKLQFPLAALTILIGGAKYDDDCHLKKVCGRGTTYNAGSEQCALIDDPYSSTQTPDVEPFPLAVLTKLIKDCATYIEVCGLGTTYNADSNACEMPINAQNYIHESKSP